ncbi:hypothetical protein IWQ62_000128 [Dispira parvispora]|uniref:N-acetyltransferase domain-containing protein n=1 Tax=Dispira parvispora TaxID=1520584 RepID=A0A9W8AVE2_9FUNG|nr:hypothetical protein IWQ62_000128 [Dispira parvispora]
MLVATPDPKLKIVKEEELLVIRDAHSLDERMIPFEWSAIMQWDPCVYEHAMHGKMPTNRILLGVVNGRIVSCLVVHVFENQTGFFGPLIVLNPNDRGKGYGHGLMQYMLHAYRGYVLGCNGAVEKVKYYQQYGMQAHHTVQRWRGTFPSSCAHLAARHQPQYHVMQDNDRALSVMIQMDYEATGVRRCQFWKSWLAQKERITLVMNSGEQDNEQRPAAVGCLTPVGQTGVYRLAPVFAVDRASAIALGLELMQRVMDVDPMSESSTADLKFDIACESENPDAEEICRDLFQWGAGIQGVKLWKGGKPIAQHPNRMYGVAGLECN